MHDKAVRNIISLAFITCLGLTIPVAGQVKDAGLWASLSMEAKVAKKLTISVLQEFRFDENMTELGNAFTEAGLEYKLNKNFQISAGYRFSQKHRIDDSYSLRHRILADIKYSKKIKPFEFSLRSRFQDQFSDFNSSSGGKIPEFYLRNKLSLKWDTKIAFAPFISVELFSPLKNHPNYAFDDIRYMAGVGYSVSKHHKLELFYMIQNEMNVSEPQTDFIAGVGYYYKL